MSPSASAAAAWSQPARSLRQRPLLRGVALAASSIVLAQYLAGCLFLAWLRLDVREAGPLTIARYAYHYGHRREVLRRLIVCSGAGLALTLVAGAVALRPRPRALHGDARFARRREIRAAGLFGEHGIILGRIGRHCLMLAGQQGVALAAPPRSGKGVGVVVPNALNWPGSLVCIDIKRENWTLTAGYRAQQGQ